MRVVSGVESDLGTKLLAVAQNLAIDAISIVVVGAFQAEGVRCIVLKGPALTDWLYGPASDRSSEDVDLLVAPKTVPSAEDALRGLGYMPLMPAVHPSDRPRYARAWHRGAGTVNVDLHTTLVGIRVPPDEAWRVLAAETQDVTVGRMRMQVLSPGAQALHLALHAAKHGRHPERPRRDLERALETLLPEVWREAAALAVRLDAVPAFAAGLSFVPEGEALVARLGFVGTTSLDAALRKQGAPALSLGVAWLAEVPGIRAKTRFVLGKVAPTPDYMRSWHPLARRGHLGLLAAYAYRPIWLLLKLGPALAAWRRARKVSVGDR